jgi:hypothetical protein
MGRRAAASVVTAVDPGFAEPGSLSDPDTTEAMKAVAYTIVAQRHADTGHLRRGAGDAEAAFVVTATVAAHYSTKATTSKPSTIAWPGEADTAARHLRCRDAFQWVVEPMDAGRAAFVA